MTRTTHMQKMAEQFAKENLQIFEEIASPIGDKTEDYVAFMQFLADECISRAEKAAIAKAKGGQL